MDVFTAGLSEGEDGATMRYCMDTTRGGEIRANAMFWFEFELTQHTASSLDVESLQAWKKKFVPAAGTASGDGSGVLGYEYN